MKLLILTDGIFPFVVGGMQRHSHYLAKFMTLRGHQVTLVHCVPFDKSAPSPEETAEALGLKGKSNFESICLKFPRPGYFPGHYLKESYFYSKLIWDKLSNRINDFDFIYAKGFSAWHFLAEKDKGKKMPPIGVKFHGYEMFQPPASKKAILQHWLLRSPVKWNSQKADKVFSYGGKITDIIRSLGIPDSRIIEVPTGIDESWFVKEAKEAHQPVKFLFIGRFERRKGIQELNAVLKEIQATVSFEFHFIGPIPATQKIAGPQFIYHGQITDGDEMRKIMDDCDVLVVPSHSEGMPNVIMEGMARGLAILATDVGGVAVQIDNSSGWLIAPANTEALRSSIVQIATLAPDELKIKKKGALERVVGHFGWNHIAEIIDEKIAPKV